MKVKFLQQGGAMAAAPADAAAQQGAVSPEETQEQGGAPEEQIMEMAMQIVQEVGPEGAAMLAQAIMQILEQASAPQEQPVFARKGAKLVRVK